MVSKSAIGCFSITLTLLGCGRLDYETVELEGADEAVEVANEELASVPVTEQNASPNVGEPCEEHQECFVGLLCRTAQCSLPESCLELKTTRPETTDGRYALRVRDAPPETGEVHFCDMTRDGGGWTLLTRSWIASETMGDVTVIEGHDAENGGLRLQVYANAEGCSGPGAKQSFHLFGINEKIGWERLRLVQRFSGQADCFATFGAQTPFTGPTATNLVPLDPVIDTIRDELRMGPDADAFGGISSACTTDAHFMNSWSPQLLRRAEVILRKDQPDLPASYGTGVGCNAFGAGTSSPTWWIYHDIFVR